LKKDLDLNIEILAVKNGCDSTVKNNEGYEAGPSIDYDGTDFR